ncbi:MAG: cellobiose phosphorylase [Clostridium sp.]|nr:cellobiose phosphorylase [Clostridium sp.]MCM1399474.1 cellobiose phosphorylase [Clostridium sp.]MCM1460028.1 cellobiose phosphorylase [Bacteroides sp.]
MGTIQFKNETGEFQIRRPENYSYLYFPVAGVTGIKSAVTPNLGGDSKLNQNTFLLEPVSVENLHNNRGCRNFWINIKGKGIWSVVGASARQELDKFTDNQDDSTVTAGFMWHSAWRKSDKYGLSAEVVTFVPLGHNVEIMYVTVKNTGKDSVTIRPTAAIPLFARSADNIRDHRHVTSLLHRIRTMESGVYVKPTLSFDEHGHRKNELTYFVCGVTGCGEKPEEFYPTTEGFIGEGGTLTNPGMLREDKSGISAGNVIEGKEALGGLRFKEITLTSGEEAVYTILMGVTGDEADIDKALNAFSSKDKVTGALQEVKEYWNKQVNVGYHTGNKEFDGFMKWVSFQPFLRRIYGCSFLPHHDYGRGGRGWRDLWQDCLSLLIMDPGGVRQMILDNYGGVRIDGTNATIIGEGQGNFIADRNGIARVWMDHGVWPYMTTELYIHQTGDVDILREKTPYFKDEQTERGTDLDREWNDEYGVCQKTSDGEIYYGTVLEHILLEQLCAFYEVGEHNHIKLRGADWNDALDMASEHGESVAFTCAYAGNLKDMADLLANIAEKYKWVDVEVLEEMELLLKDDEALYNDASAKRKLLKRYTDSCRHNVSGRKITIPITRLVHNLKNKAEWMMEHIRNTEWIQGTDENEEEGWFNSYYDNHKRQVEGYFPNEVRMMLTGQVFAVMSGTASSVQVEKICRTADHYLYQKNIGGYRLNTNFHEDKIDLGRMFGFAYGEKENGAVFSHMTVMYAAALYRRGFVKEGYKALQTLADNAMNFEVSKIYPGIPEYFDGSGRGMYHYLTGAASWYMLVFITEVFNVKGIYGNLTISPRLVKEQFDKEGIAVLQLCFAGKRFQVVVENKQELEYGMYRLVKATCNDKELLIEHNKAVMAAEEIMKLNFEENKIIITLGR